MITDQSQGGSDREGAAAPGEGRGRSGESDELLRWSGQAQQPSAVSSQCESANQSPVLH